MKPTGKKLWLAALLVVIVTCSLLLLLSDEPYYRGRPVSQWAVDYSQTLYPNGTAPLSPSQRGLSALRQMGPHKAATAMVHALTWNDSKLYERYRVLHPKLPSWYRNWFPLKLTHQQRVTLILGVTEFLDLDYQRAMVPFLIEDLEKPDARAQIAACEILSKMPEAAVPAMPILKGLTASAEPSLSQAAQAAVGRINVP